MEATVPNNSALFANEHSVLEALVLVRNAPIATEDKALIRDLFLDYVASEGDDNLSLRQEIITKLQNTKGIPKDLLKLIPADSEKAVSGQKEIGPVDQASSNTRLGHVRPSLSFSPASAADDVLDKEETPVPVAERDSTVEDSSEPEKESPTQSLKEEPELQPKTPNSGVEDTQDSEPAQAPAPEPEIPTKPSPEEGDPKARINTIKHDINTAVGNPVNLINMDATIGREYMSALLEAMKSVSSGSVATAELSRLETAYAEAKKLIEKSGGSPITEQPKQAKQVRSAESKPAPTVSQSTPGTQAEPVEEAASKAPEPEPEPTKNTGLYHRPEDEVQEEVKDKDKESLVKNDTAEKRSALANLATGLWTKKGKKANNEDVQSTQEEKPTSTPLTTPLEKSAVRKVKAVGEEEEGKETYSKEQKTSNKEEKKVQPQNSEGSTLKPISTATSLPEKMSEVQKAAEKAEEERSKPVTDLKSPEVTAGLEQLLSEWKLFKKSGMFGTGPKGINHPLYKKLADQPMAVVVAGRFEGSTPDIKQSLTSYMNGWRYEQGIIHEMGETFETYLRRVILRILQKNRNNSKAQ